MHVSPLIVGLVCSAGFVGHVVAQTSRITQVTVYPGSATVERTLTLPTGARQAVFTCLPANLDVPSLQVSAAKNISVGEIAVRQQARAWIPECASPQQKRIQALEDQIAALEAEEQGLAQQDTWLNRFTSPSNAAQIASTAEAVRKTAQSSALRQHAIAREKQVLMEQLQPLQADWERTAGRAPQVNVVHITVDAPSGGTLALSYQVRGPSWQPAYRGLLNTQTQRLVLERTAQVAQNTGEDWSDVPLLLSTGQPHRIAYAPLPRPWRIAQQEPVQALSSADAQKKIYREVPVAEIAAPAPATFDAHVFEGTHATTFRLPQRVSIPSYGDQLSFTLGQYPLAAQLLVRTTPAVDTSAFLIANIQLPEGVWPAGKIRLYRDGAYTGTSPFNAENLAQNGLGFGLDERVQVRALPDLKQQSSSGFFNNRQQHEIRNTWEIHNQHNTAIELQVLDAAPIAEHSDIRITSTYRPQPSTQSWQQHPGTVAWDMQLPAGQQQRFSSTHTISWPESMQVKEQR